MTNGQIQRRPDWSPARRAAAPAVPAARTLYVDGTPGAIEACRRGHPYRLTRVVLADGRVAQRVDLVARPAPPAGPPRWFWAGLLVVILAVVAGVGWAVAVAWPVLLGALVLLALAGGIGGARYVTNVNVFNGR